MTLFERIVYDLLNEDVSISKVNDAINNTYEVKINYKSNTDSASGARIIQPVAYGLSKSGNPVVRAFQPFGDTQTKVPSWKFFLLNGIKYWKPLKKQKFTKPEKFNPNGDKTMSIVYNIAKFDEPRQNIKTQPKTTGPVTKTNVINNTLQNQQHISVKDNPEVQKLEKLKKQLDNPRYFSDIIKNNTLGQLDDKSNNIDNQEKQITADSGPITKDTFKTQTEKDIESRNTQLNKNEKVSNDVLNQWKKEQEKRKNKINNLNIKWN